MDAEDPTLGVDAVVSWYAPASLSNLWQDRIDDAVPGENEREPDPTPEAQLLGVSPLEYPAIGDAASPDARAAILPSDATVPPTYLVHGDSDPRVSPLQSARVRDVLAARGTEVSLDTVKGGRHGGDGFDAMVAPSIEHILTNLTAD